jgi:starvation-inducible outer membrane lipoprotein
MTFCRVFAAAGALALAASISVPANAQDKQPAPEQQQRKLSNDERKEYVALNELVDAVMAGKQPAPADVKLKFRTISSSRPKMSMSRTSLK